MKEKKKRKKEIRRLARLIGRIPGKAAEARKNYSALDLMRRIRTVCSAIPEETSMETQIENLESVGKRIAFIRNEFSKSDFNDIMRYATGCFINGHGRDDAWRKDAIRCIESAFEEQKKDCHMLKESCGDLKGWRGGRRRGKKTGRRAG